MTWVLDAHQDIAWNSLTHGRDYLSSALVHRQREAGRSGYPAAQLGLPDALLGRVAISFATLFVEPLRKHATIQTPLPAPRYVDARQAYTLAGQQLDVYARLEDESERLRIIRTGADLDAVLATWQDDEAMQKRTQGLVVLMEGADPIIEPRQFEEWYERGVRIVGPAWQATRYAGGTGMPGGLTNLGHELLELLASFNVMLDLSHLAEQAFYEAVDRYEGVMIASHSNPRRFCNTDRHLSDDMIRQLAERGGVMGVVLYAPFLRGGWRRSDGLLPMSIVADVIDHICQVTGSAQHVGIGSDFDGGFGGGSVPAGLDSVSDLLRIADLLQARGYEQGDIEAVMHGNFLRQLRAVLPE